MLTSGFKLQKSCRTLCCSISGGCVNKQPKKFILDGMIVVLIIGFDKADSTL